MRLGSIWRGDAMLSTHKAGRLDFSFADMQFSCRVIYSTAIWSAIRKLSRYAKSVMLSVLKSVTIACIFTSTVCRPHSCAQVVQKTEKQRGVSIYCRLHNQCRMQMAELGWPLHYRQRAYRERKEKLLQTLVEKVEKLEAAYSVIKDERDQLQRRLDNLTNPTGLVKDNILNLDDQFGSLTEFQFNNFLFSNLPRQHTILPLSW